MRTKKKRGAGKTEPPEFFLVWTPEGFRVPKDFDTGPQVTGARTFFGKSAGIRARSADGLARLIQKGLPLTSFSCLQKALGVTVAELCGILRISVSTLRRRRISGRFTVEESERIARLACVVDKAVDVMGSEDAARGWMKSPIMALAHKTPLSYCGTESGGREVEIVLGHIEHGIFS